MVIRGEDQDDQDDQDRIGVSLLALLFDNGEVVGLEFIIFDAMYWF